MPLKKQFLNKFVITNMKNQIQKSLLNGIRELHIKILQTNNLTEIGNYLQEILDKVVQIPPEYNKKLRNKYWKDVSHSDVVNLLKTDINAILDGTYNRAEIAKYKATLGIAWLKRLFTEPLAQ
jgi:lipoate-protein ligase A